MVPFFSGSEIDRFNRFDPEGFNDRFHVHVLW